MRLEIGDTEMTKQAAPNVDLIRELAFNLPATTLAQIVADLEFANESDWTMQIIRNIMASQGESTAGLEEFAELVEAA